MSANNILNIRKPEKLRTIRPEYFPLGFNDRQFDHIFKIAGATWFYEGVPEFPHTVTRKGECTDGFVDTLEVLSYTNLCFIIARQAVARIRQAYQGPIDWVVGSDHAGAAFSLMVAFLLGARHDFTEKDPTDPKGQRHLWKRRTILPEEIVLQVEELVTTTGTLEQVRAAIKIGNKYPVMYAPISYTCIHRSDVYDAFGSPLLFGRHYNIKTWPRSECPLCKSGSRRIESPKKNWAELTGKTM